MTTAGVPEEVKNKIFDPFFTPRRSAKAPVLA